MKTTHVYIATNNARTLYIGVTSNLELRINQHEQKVYVGFTSKYNISKLIYCEEFSDPCDAIAREKQLKRWSRRKKIYLIERFNPGWEDLRSLHSGRDDG